MPWEKQFDRDEVLDRAEQTFWLGGYEATSLETLLDRMGIQKGSFYATFASKHTVLIESLNRYIGQRYASFEEAAAKDPPLEALERHFQEMLKECTGQNASRGCFLVNIALEMAPRDKTIRSMVRRTLQAHQDFYRRLLESARTRGAIPKDYDVDAGAASLLGLLLGMRVMSRAGMPKASIQALHDRALEIAGVVSKTAASKT
jgi:TetR/AcrR family transcriptional repressor of nem operon